MRIESTVTSISWIPSEAMTGPLRLPVDMGIGLYDDPLPDHIDDGRVVDSGYAGGGMIGSTTLALGLGSITIPAVPFPHIRHEPIVTARRLRRHEVDRPLD